MNCLCEVKLNNNNFMNGFICNIHFHQPDKPLRVLITKYYSLKNLEKIKIFLENKTAKKRTIDLSKKRKIYYKQIYNILIIEIIDEDNLQNFLDLNLDSEIKKDDIIYILKNKSPFPFGEINSICEHKIGYNLQSSEINGDITEGNPIISLKSFQAIGMVNNKDNLKTGALLKYYIEKLYKESNSIIHYKKEANVKARPLNGRETMTILKQMEEKICKIIVESKTGTGFFCKIPFPDDCNLLPVLITNNHVLEEKDIEINKKIKFSLNDDEQSKEITITSERKTYTDKKYDTTIIEIFKNEEDIIKYLDYNFDDDFVTKNSQVYIIQYPKGDKASHSTGMLSNIDNYEILHKCDTDKGSSGSPILLLDNFKVFGIHKGARLNLNLGTVLKYPVQSFNEKYKNNINNNNINDNINNNDMKD
jgi:hypothetical protein